MNTGGNNSSHSSKHPGKPRAHIIYFHILDRKFALKSRLTGSLQITMDVIKQNANNFKVLHPALLVIKLSAGSSKYYLVIRIIT